MLLLIVGLIGFLGLHLIPTKPELRDSFRERFGAGPYQIGFSILSLITFVLIVMGYHKLQVQPGKNLFLWPPPAWTRHAALALMLPAMIFLVAAYVPSRIRTAVKHPMLIAVKIWAFAHLISHGDMASLLLFGSFLAYAIYDFKSVKARGARGPLGDKTSTSLRNDVIVVAAGTALYAAMIFGLHEWLIGVSPLASMARV